VKRGIARGELEELAAAHHESEPEAILSLALSRFDDVVVAFSGAEDVVLVELASRLRPGISVFCLDTGRLHPETYRFIDQVRQTYPISLEVLSPDAVLVERLVRSKGLFSFYEEGHTECCDVRKVGPLRRRLASVDAWVTGQRRDQSPDTRGALQVIEEDQAFSTAEHRVVKLNPLAGWSAARVWSYVTERGLPSNELFGRGFRSIGCEPCTRPVLPSQHEREGRWWWELADQKECGIHSPRRPQR
jgi:phosphoadenosine phosphosulfate reductase